MRIARTGGQITIRDRAAPSWALGLLLLLGGVVAMAAALGLATNAADVELWERLATFGIGLGVSAGAMWWLRRSPASRVELDPTRSRVSVVRLGLSGRQVRELAFSDLASVEVEVGADSDGGTVWRPAVRLRGGEPVLLSELWSRGALSNDSGEDDGHTPRRHQTIPPFARSTWPLIQPPSGPTRNDTALAMSSGVPKRSSGGAFASRSIISCVFPVRNSSVAVGAPCRRGRLARAAGVGARRTSADTVNARYRPPPRARLTPRAASAARR